MSRLIVISNRVSRPSQGGNQGGLAVALNAALAKHSGIWFGWSGEQVDSFTGKLTTEEQDGVTIATVDLEEQDVEEYYNGFANRTLWPLFHYRIDLAENDRSFGSGYERVNKQLGDIIAPHIQPGDLVWVHDYHLIPMAWNLRRQGISNRIGFFLHTPWPPTKLLVALPHHERLVESLFAYDVVGFQTEEWLDSFRHYCETEMNGAIDGDVITVGDRHILAIACPIGLDYDNFLAASRSERAMRTFRTTRASLQDRKFMIGVDRLDYSKGIAERFGAIERLLQDSPALHRNLVTVQIAPPSRADVATYQEIRANLEALTGRINGAFAHVDWTPIRYVNKGYPRDELAGIYRAANIALVTPLRDGMNLVAKEYVVAQDPDDPGVLILSRFAGAAHQMTEALLINPHSPEEMADAIRTALAMPLEERKRRWSGLIDGVRSQDVQWWCNRFVEELAGASTVTDAPSLTPAPA